MKKYDLIVAGGGLSGVAAGVCAAREGAKTLIVEKNANLGGAASNCLINPFMKYSLKKKDAQGKPYYEQLNCGLFKEIVDRLRGMGALNEADMFGVAFNIEYMKKILEEIQDGTFASKWIAENNNGRAHFNAKRAMEASHQLEEVGKELRKMYSWSGEKEDM